jgi:uncharacterized membrane protein YgcG|uniref:Intron-binding protein aquarius N-terminus n=1 Tax=Myoviridae sp. ctshb19 TaxID=2825194 RepID=A0A8S5UG63_9CAUD|nr:MAG TPA: Intron-binding protein aquarius N-terminus [Myoviridae sp. ctshb19]
MSSGPKFRWYDVLFGTNAFKVFQQHYRLLAYSNERLEEKVLGLNREATKRNSEIARMQQELNLVRDDNSRLNREITRLRARIAGVDLSKDGPRVDVGNGQSVPVSMGRESQDKKVERYAAQYGAGSIHRPVTAQVHESTTSLSQAMMAQQVLDDAIDRANGYPADDIAPAGNRRPREPEIPAYVQESRPEPVRESYSPPVHETRSYVSPSRHDDSPSSSDRSGGWGGGDSGGSSDGGGGGGD